MCGIAGIFNRGSGQAVNPESLSAMVRCLEHRGPDESGLYFDGPVGFAHTRLKIIDIGGGQQPMCDESGQVTLVYNGEVWNYKKVREDLRARGFSFRSVSDTEVVLNAYLAYGEEFASELDGMFALALWDARTGRLVLARDRLGKKPLYYGETDQGDLVFGSEIKAVLADPRFPPEVDYQALSDFLVLRYVPAPRTMFAGIHKLPPSTLMVVGERSSASRPYWQLPVVGTEEVPATRQELERRVRERVQEAVEARLMSDVPLGALLSGGVDSSVIVAAASSLLDTPLKTFSVRFVDAPPSFDESPYARYVAERFGTEHHEHVVGEREMLDSLPTVAWHRDEPMSEPSEIPTYLICRAAKPHATVLLSGEGGDELFAGYPKYGYDWLANYLTILPSWARGRARDLADAVPSRFRRAKVAARSLLEADEAVRWASWFGAFVERDKTRLLSDKSLAHIAERDTSRFFRQHFPSLNQGDSLSRMLYMDTAVWLPDNLLMKGDRMSMAASTELRMPFLDRHLLEFAVSIPSNRRIRPFVSKYLLKESYVGILPRKFLYRRKVGFQVPVALWLRSQRFGFLRDILTGDRALGRGIFRPEAVRNVLEEHLSGRQNHQSKLFVLLALELWQRMYIDRSFDSAPEWEDILDAGELEMMRSGEGAIAQRTRLV